MVKNKISELRNVEVKVLRAHSNSYGSSFFKRADDVYIHPRPQAEIDAGIVAVAGTESSSPPSPRGKRRASA